MICEVIAKEGEPGSGGGRDAFHPGILYDCEKASRVELRNLSCSNWTDAAEEMILTSRLSAKVKKPYYHIVLSWHETERPTEAQQIAAMDRMLRALGLHEHQAVIATHDDTPRRHVHAVINTVHPLTGRAWSKSNDRRRAEQACRQIELEMGWPHDRGQYDVVVQEIEGRKTAKLVARPEEHYREIKMAREGGRRKKTSAQTKVEKRAGIEVFDHAIPDALKIKLWKALDTCRTWQDVHTVFHDLGLRYDRFGSGARVYLVGSTEFVKASSFGARLSISRMEKLFGAFKPAEAMPKRNPGSDLSSTCGLIGQVAPEDEKATRATAFKTTLLRRIYIEIHIDSRVAREIRFVDLAALPPQITFRSGAVVILGDPNSSSRMVVLEGGLDALALAEIENRLDTIYVSTGGGFGPETERALMHLAAGRETLGGFDNDRAGESMYAALTKLVTGAIRLAPPSRVSGADVDCKDWLDVLNARKKASAAHWIGAEKSAGIHRENDNDERLGAEEDRTSPDFT